MTLAAHAGLVPERHARLGGSRRDHPGSGTWQIETATACDERRRGEHVREACRYWPRIAMRWIRSFADGKDLASDLGERKFAAMASLVDKPLIIWSRRSISVPVAGRLEDAR